MSNIRAIARPDVTISQIIGREELARLSPLPGFLESKWRKTEKVSNLE